MALAGFMALSPMASAWAQTFGPVSSYEELSGLLLAAKDGDTILLSGDISADGKSPLSSLSSVCLKAEGSATLRGLHLQDASLSIVGVALEDGLTVSGTSHVLLGKDVTITGSSGSAALSFSGNGALIVERGCAIEGGTGSPGLSIRHDGGEFYGSIEGRVTGGSGASGGAGVIVSPLQEGGAVMITGSIHGGDGTSLGGHALNLYDLSGNAYVTVDGNLQGGVGSIGGDGIQLISASDTVNVGIIGTVKGGSGESYGGNALILLDAEGSSTVNLSGHFSGGDALGSNAQPGTSLHLIGDSSSLRTRMDNCILEDGKKLNPTAVPTAAPTSEPTPEPTPESTAEPTPEPTAPESTESGELPDPVSSDAPENALPEDRTEEDTQASEEESKTEIKADAEESREDALKPKSSDSDSPDIDSPENP